MCQLNICYCTCVRREYIYMHPTRWTEREDVYELISILRAINVLRVLMEKLRLSSLLNFMSGWHQNWIWTLKTGNPNTGYWSRTHTRITGWVLTPILVQPTSKSNVGMAIACLVSSVGSWCVFDLTWYSIAKATHWDCSWSGRKGFVIILAAKMFASCKCLVSSEP